MHAADSLRNCMGVCLAPLRRLNRTRVSRGFSVHSPFAFYFITRVLREHLPFYCFDRELKTVRERRLFRLVNYFRPETVCILGADGAARALEVMRMASANVRLVSVPDAADFVFACPDVDSLPPHCRVLYAPRPARATRRALIAATSRGMTFANARAIIAVTRPGIPRQHFSLSF